LDGHNPSNPLYTSYFMLTLNLVSQELKKEIKLQRIYKLLKEINCILIIITIIIAIIFLTARLILQNNFNKIVDQTTLVTKNNQGYNAKVREINSQLNFISQIQEDFIPWSYLIEDLVQNTPPDITFSLIEINQGKQTIIIKGRADFRSSLLTLKQYLEESPICSEIKFPLKNILQKNDIDFEINAKLNLKEL